MPLDSSELVNSDMMSTEEEDVPTPMCIALELSSGSNDDTVARFPNERPVDELDDVECVSACRKEDKNVVLTGSSVSVGSCCCTAADTLGVDDGLTLGDAVGARDGNAAGLCVGVAAMLGVGLSFVGISQCVPVNPFVHVHVPFPPDPSSQLAPFLQSHTPPQLTP